MNRKEFLKTVTATIGTAIILPFAPNNGLFARIPQAPPKIRVKRNGEGKRINVLGDRMTYKLTGKDTGGKYCLIEQHNEPGVGIPLHVHEREDEVFRVLEGQIELSAGNETYRLKAGDMAFCPKNIPHTWRIVGDQMARVDLSFFPAGLELTFDELALLPPGPPDPQLLDEICSRYGLRFI